MLVIIAQFCFLEAVTLHHQCDNEDMVYTHPLFDVFAVDVCLLRIG